MAQVSASTAVGPAHGPEERESVYATGEGSSLGNSSVELPVDVLNNVSAEQLERLRRRQVQERSAEEDREKTNVVASWVVPLRMFCLLLFSIFLLIKLDHFASTSMPWVIVFIPLWVSNALKIFYHVVKLRFFYAQASETTLATPWHHIYASWIQVVGDLGSVVTKAILCFVLSGTRMSLLLTFVPFWIAIFCGSILKYMSPLDPDIAHRVHYKRAKRLYDACMYFGLSIIMPMIICLKIDGLYTEPWGTCFIPLWFFCFNLAAVAFILLPVYAINVMFGETSRSFHTRQERVSLFTMMITFIYGIGSTVCCFFSFLVMLSQKLDNVGDAVISNGQIMVPLIVMFANLMVFSPLARCYLARLAHADEQTRLPEEVMDPQAGTTRGYSDNSEGLFAAITSPVTLLQQSSTLFQRIEAHEINQSPVKREVGSNNSRMSSPSNVVHPLKIVIDGGSAGRAGSACVEDEEKTSGQDPKAAVMSQVDPGQDPKAAVMSQVDPGSIKSGNFVECYICADREANAVLMNCGHGGMCYECGLILARREGEKICPVCRSSIEQVLKICSQSVHADGQVVFVASEGMVVHSPIKKKQVDDHVSVATDDNSDGEGEQNEEKEAPDEPRVDTGHEGGDGNRFPPPPPPPPPSRHPPLAQEDTTETSNGERESSEKA